MGKLLCDLKKVTLFPRKLFKEIWCNKIILTPAHAFTLYGNPGLDPHTLVINWFLPLPQGDPVHDSPATPKFRETQ